jgi:hypothetical protein
MPTNNGVRLHDRQRTANFREQPIETNEYQAVDGAEGEFLWSSSPQNVYLLPQSPNLCLERCPRPDQIDNRPTNKPEKIPHYTTSSPDSPLPASRMRFTTGTPSLTPEEIQVARIRLARWQCVKAFSADAKALCNRCRSADYFLQPRLKFLHNAHVLAQFARLQSVDQVRLADHDENWPDGFVEIQNRAFNIEVTSTHGGRKLGDEYRHLKGWRFDPVEDWVARANSIPKYLDEAISGKSKKNYSSPCWLVVYLNISEYGIRQPETEQVIAATKARYAAAFVDITVLWKGKLY